jgi:pantothenate kinase
MTPLTLSKLDDVLRLIEQKSAQKDRFMIAIAGCPGAGKSTISHYLHARLTDSKIVQMDGFHLANDILKNHHLLSRKGSPDSFDVEGFSALLSRIKHKTTRTHNHKDAIYAPLFNRELDASIGCAIEIKDSDKFILVEGNYLLLEQDVWRDLQPLFDLTLFLQVDESTLISRLTQRWLDLGLEPKTALDKVNLNDALNIELVKDNLIEPDVFVTLSS